MGSAHDVIVNRVVMNRYKVRFLPSVILREPKNLYASTGYMHRMLHGVCPELAEGFRVKNPGP